MKPNTDRSLETIRKEIDNLSGEIAKERASASALHEALALGGPLPVASASLRMQHAVTAWETPDKARKALEEWWAKSVEAHTQNKVVIAHNAVIRQAVLCVLDSIGLGRKQSVEVSRRRGIPKYATHTADWVSAVNRATPTEDNFDMAERDYKVYQGDIKKWEQRIAAEKQEAKRKREAEEQARLAERKAGALATRYGASVSASPEEVLTAILNSNKYLRLAYYLAKNRGDWSDGCSLAETGLDGFSVESAEDKEIYADLARHISDWGGDGRVFRDTVWNYDRLFFKVQAECPQLYKDYLEMRASDVD